MAIFGKFYRLPTDMRCQMPGTSLVNSSRALKIKDKILAGYNGQGRFERCSDGRSVIRTMSWEASIHSPFNPFRSHRRFRMPSSTSGRRLLECLLPYKMELVLVGGPVVSRLAWSDRTFEVFLHKPGYWESHFFGLPQLPGKYGITSWEKRIDAPSLVTLCQPSPEYRWNKQFIRPIELTLSSAD